MKRRKFITACACCAFAGAGIALYNKDNIFKDTNDFVMNHVEVHIAEHCNLNCKYCCHFSCIAEEEFYELDKFKKDLKRMSYVFNKKLLDMQILGGEPLLNPLINEYVKHARKCFPNTRISITTNATLLDDKDEQFWKTLNEYNINLAPSIYPVKINWKSILDKAKKYNVVVYGNIIQGDILTIDNIDKFKRTFFRKMAMSEKGYKGVSRPKCDRRFICNSMYDAKLYPCTNIAYVRHLNKKFNTNFIVTENDYIDLYKVKSIKEIENFLSNREFPFCNYCELTSKEVKWENSSEHSLSEWT